MKYKIAIKEIGTKKYTWKEIDADSVKIRGYAEFEFFYHASQELFTSNPMVISEKTSGCMVSEGKNKRECLKNALTNLMSISKDEFRKRISDKLKLIKSPKKKAV